MTSTQANQLQTIYNKIDGMNSFNLVYGGNWKGGQKSTYQYTPDISGKYLMNVACSGGNTLASATLSGTYKIIAEHLTGHNNSGNGFTGLSNMYILELTANNTITINTTAGANCWASCVSIYRL